MTTWNRFLNSFLHTGTPDEKSFLRGDGAWADPMSGYEYITPTSITVNTGGTPVGTVTNVQTLHDGNVYQIPETATTPGFDIDFEFTNVDSIVGFVSHIRYDGLAAGHTVTLRLYNYTDVQDDSFLIIGDTGSLYAYRTVFIPSDTKYISSNESTVVLYHDSAGAAAHDAYVDYIALIGNTI